MIMPFLKKISDPKQGEVSVSLQHCSHEAIAGING